MCALYVDDHNGSFNGRHIVGKQGLEAFSAYLL